MMEHAQLCAARLAADLVETQIRRYPGNRSLARLHVSRAVEKCDRVLRVNRVLVDPDERNAAHSMRAALLTAWGGAQ